MSIFGQMSFAAYESRIEWMDRLSRQTLMLLDLGATIPDEMRIERLLNGLHDHKTYSHEANIVQLILHSWESLVSQLREPGIYRRVIRKAQKKLILFLLLFVTCVESLAIKFLLVI